MSSGCDNTLPLYRRLENGGRECHPAYSNLLDRAWDDLNDTEGDSMARPIADARVNEEIASFGGVTTFGIDGYIEFPSQEHKIAFLMKWA
jgi:hypothetical protein